MTFLIFISPLSRLLIRVDVSLFASLVFGVSASGAVAPVNGGQGRVAFLLTREVKIDQ